MMTFTLQRYRMFFFFSSRRRHTRFDCDWSSDVCSSDLPCPSAWCIPFRRPGGGPHFTPSRIVPEDLLAHVRDLARTRGPRPLAALGARAAGAARTDDARGPGERVPDPGDVEDLGHRVEPLGSW